MNDYHGHSKYGATVNGTIVPLNEDGTNDWDAQMHAPEYVWVRSSGRARPHWRKLDSRPFSIRTKRGVQSSSHAGDVKTWAVIA